LEYYKGISEWFTHYTDKKAYSKGTVLDLRPIPKS